MFERIIRFAIEQRWLVLLAVFGMAALGVFSYQKLPIDAVPDITNVQVQINTQTPGYSPLETEQRVTYPLETVMAGLPGLEQTRSLSRYGLSQITVIFKDGTDLYFARQLVNERIQEAKARLPQGVTPAMGPISTGLGEIYMWTVEAKDGAKKPDGTAYTPTDLREIQDWIIKPQLRNVTGVTEINSIGGYAKEYQVAPSPEKLMAHGLTLGDVVNALERNNGNVGAGYIEREGEQYLIRAPGQVRGTQDLGSIIVKQTTDVPIRIRDIAEVGQGKELRTGAATDNGREVVLGTVFMLIGENSRKVSQAVDIKMAEINKSLNDRLSRTEFMPFAPSCLAEFADARLRHACAGPAWGEKRLRLRCRRRLRRPRLPAVAQPGPQPGHPGGYGRAVRAVTQVCSGFRSAKLAQRSAVTFTG